MAEYLIDLNATQAAIRAGYHRKMAAQLVAKPSITAAIAAGKAKQLTTADLSAQRVIEELRRLALVDARDFYDAGGNVKPLSELTAAQGAALQSVEVIIKNAQAGDKHTDTVHKIKLWDKPKALDILAKHFGLLKESLDVTGELTITWQAPTS